MRSPSKKRLWPWKKSINGRVVSADTAVSSVSVNQKNQSLFQIPSFSSSKQIRPLSVQSFKKTLRFDRWSTSISPSDMDLLATPVASSELSWENIRNHEVFDPHSKSIAKWNTIIFIIVIYDGLVVPFLIAFQIAHHDMCAYTGYYDSMNILEVFFLADIYIRLHTGYYENGDLVRETRATTKKYFLSRQFLLDVTALLPLSLLLNLTLCGALHLNKLIRLRRVGLYLIDFDTVFARYFKFCKLIKVIVALCVFCHYCGCIYILFGFDPRPHSIDVEPWRLRGHLAHETLELQYLAAVVW